MRLTAQQGYMLLEKHGSYVKEVCDKCGKGIGPVRYTRARESGVWCSPGCRGDQEQKLAHKGGRPRKYRNNAVKQRAYRARYETSLQLAVNKDVVNVKTPLWQLPLRENQ
jgi:hypothetical protein